MLKIFISIVAYDTLFFSFHSVHLFQFFKQPYSLISKEQKIIITSYYLCLLLAFHYFCFGSQFYLLEMYSIILKGHITLRYRRDIKKTLKSVHTCSFGCILIFCLTLADIKRSTCLFREVEN